MVGRIGGRGVELDWEGMKYLCLVIIGENQLQTFSGTEAQALDDESLEPVSAVRTIRLRAVRYAGPTRFTTPT